MPKTDYRKDINAAVRGLWRGEIDERDFFNSMFLAISRHFEIAWREGAAEVGILPDDRSIDERATLLELISRQSRFIPGFANDIINNSKEDGMKLTPHLKRAEIWVNRYDEVKNQAKATSGADEKLEWVLGPTEHCSSCLSLRGKVKRASQWRLANIRPQMRRVECGGWRCQCQLVKTDKPLSKGRLPSI